MRTTRATWRSLDGAISRRILGPTRGWKEAGRKEKAREGETGSGDTRPIRQLVHN
jgi:hypothetical protein